MVQNKIDLGGRTKEVPSDPKHGKKVKIGSRLPKKLQAASNNDSLLTCDELQNINTSAKMNRPCPRS
jgi:hypothetical protein